MRQRDQSYGLYIAGRAIIDTADQVAMTMEAKWGCGRLRLLVAPELTEKFDRQRYKWNQAIWHGDLEEVRLQAQRMTAAWRALDRAATEAGAQPLAPNVWEVALADGTVAAIVPDNTQAHAVVAQGRQMAVYTLAEIARLIEHYQTTMAVKLMFPGATVTKVRVPQGDPLDAVIDTQFDLDAPMDDPIPSFTGA